MTTVLSCSLFISFIVDIAERNIIVLTQCVKNLKNLFLGKIARSSVVCKAQVVEAYFYKHITGKNQNHTKQDEKIGLLLYTLIYIHSI